MAGQGRSNRPPVGAPRRAPARPRASSVVGLLASWPRRLKGFAWRRWLAVLICVAVLLIGIPLAHALVGDLGALLLLTGVGGFALGRATAPRPAPAAPSRRGRGKPSG